LGVIPTVMAGLVRPSTFLAPRTKKPDPSWRALCPGIHVLTRRKKEKNVDGRDKPGHDGETDATG
jgi:hypothetical protein